METNEIELITWPSGIKTQAGGTRDIVRLERPWQRALPISGECRLCERFRIEPSAVEGIPAGWRVLANSFTPHRFHRLIIPEACWPEESLRTIGGVEAIETVIRIALRVMEQCAEFDVWLGLHVGYTAGQNLPHLHWHVLRTIEDPPAPTEAAWQAVRKLQTDSLVVAESQEFVASAGGVRAGGIIIAPKRFPSEILQALPAFATILSDMVALGNRKFMSTEGMLPDFKIAIHLQSFHFDVAEYVPILNQWGFTESYQFTFGPLDKVPIILPWPHYRTAQHLRV